MKKVIKYVIAVLNIISWLFLLLLLGVDDTQYKGEFWKLMVIVAGIVIFWAANQLLLGRALSEKKTTPEQEQSIEHKKADDYGAEFEKLYKQILLQRVEDYIKK